MCELPSTTARHPLAIVTVRYPCHSPKLAPKKVRTVFVRYDLHPDHFKKKNRKKEKAFRGW
jgi:hypothetical protein